jgi:hypothetical protein
MSETAGIMFQSNFDEVNHGWESLIKLHKTWRWWLIPYRVVSGTCYSEEMATRSRKHDIQEFHLPHHPQVSRPWTNIENPSPLTNARNSIEEGSPKSDSTVYGTFDAKSKSRVFHRRKTEDKSRLQNKRVKQMAGDE